MSSIIDIPMYVAIHLFVTNRLGPIYRDYRFNPQVNHLLLKSKTVVKCDEIQFKPPQIHPLISFWLRPYSAVVLNHQVHLELT